MPLHSYCPPAHAAACLAVHLEIHRGQSFLTTEKLYPFKESSGSCDTARLLNVAAEDKFELAEGGFDVLHPWSAAALLEVRCLFNKVQRLQLVTCYKL